MSVTLVLAVILVVFLGALTRSTFGFGEAVVSMPLLTLLPIGLHTAVALMGLVGLTVALLAVATGWRHIERKELVPLLMAALIGIPVGLVMVTIVPARMTLGLLGALLMLYGAYSFRHSVRPLAVVPTTKIAKPWGVLFGFVSGVIGSAYNFNGVPVAVYGTLRRWLPDTFRSTMQAYFLFSGALIVSAQGLGGLWTADVFLLYGLSIPAVAAANLVGTMFHRRIQTGNFQRYVFLLIAVLGTVLLAKSTML